MSSSDEDSLKRPKRSKESQIYGIFAESEEESEAPKRTRSEINFVKSTQPASTESESSESSSEEEDEPNDSMKELMSVQFQSTKRPQTSKPKETKKEPLIPLEKDFAKFEKHTKGIGMKLMMKMGYTPGKALGVSGDGLVNPIEVKVRPKQMGLGKETEGQPSKAKTEPEIKETAAPNWKSIKKIRKPPKPKTVDDWIKLQEDAGMSVSAKETIIDMTGKVAKTIDSLLFSASETDLKSLPELRYNLTAIVNLCYTDVMQKTRDIRQNKHLEESVRKQLEHLTVEKQAMIQKHLLSSNSVQLVKQIQLANKRTDKLNYLEGILGPWLTSPSQYAYPDLQRKMLLHVLRQAMIEEWRSWKAFYNPLLLSSFIQKHISVLIEPKHPTSSHMDLYEKLIYEHWFPPVRNAFR
jgi:hypothetical protein